MEKLVGRQKEIERLRLCEESERAEFVIISGRRRIGKTFLINRLYGNKFVFAYTGGHNLSLNEQLMMFAERLRKYTKTPVQIKLKNWFDAFLQLENYLEKTKTNNKKILFFDEMPWIDTRNSNFVKALEYFWNSWAAQRDDIMLIATGSATSWMNDKLIENKGGLHGRITCQIFLEPFSLKESEEFLDSHDFHWDRYTIMQAYMLTGGIPFYLHMLQKKYSLAQNIDELCFAKNGLLKTEFNELYNTLFANADKYILIARTLSGKNSGLTRQQIAAKTDIQGSTLTRMLDNLEKCDFIISYPQTGKSVKDRIYRLSDFYTLFYFRFMENHNVRDVNFWSKNLDTARINTWQGLTFELICLTHLQQIKKALGISGINSVSTAWRNKDAQIDLVIDRRDRIINLCEIKFSMEKYQITKDYADKLRERMTIFRNAMKTTKTLVNTFITTYGITQGKYSSICQSEVTMDELFD
ncbi:MAG: ATP-binding protein [Bacteroidales bacterium]|nr:ATP-binding protein [Bacteroidales bacterium]